MIGLALKPVKEVITEYDRLRLKSKFALWDKFKSGNSNDNRMLALFQDPTIFSYAMLKDKEDNPLRMRPHQDILINDKNRFIVGACANQIGKSWAGAAKTIHHGLFVPNATVLITSRTFDQAKHFLKEIKEMCLRSNIEISDENDSKTMITINNWNGKGMSNLVCVSPTESALSYAPTLEVLDELGFIPNSEWFYDQIAEPRIGDTQHRKHPFLTMGQIFAISNPNSQQGAHWKLWNDSRYSRYRFDWLSHPKNTKEMFLYYKKTKPPDVFNSCYGAVFSSASGRFITADEFKNAVDNYQMVLPEKAMVFFGLDTAGEDSHSRNTDGNVMFGFIVLNEFDEDTGRKLTAKMVYYKYWPPRTPRKVIYSEIRRLYQECNFGGISYDKMGGGDTIYNSLTDPSGPYRLPMYMVHPQTFSLQNKSEVYRNLKELYQFRRIKHPDIIPLRKEVETLDFQVTTKAGHLDMTPSLKVHHYKKSMKDDHPDALALAAYEAIRMTRSVVSIQTIGRGSPRQVI